MTIDDEDARKIRYALAEELSRMNTGTDNGADKNGKRPEPFSPTRNRTDALSTVAYTATAVAIAISSYVYIGDREHDRDQIREIRTAIAIIEGAAAAISSDIEGLRIAEAKNGQREIEQKETTAYWRGRIQQIRAEQIINTKAIALIVSRVDALEKHNGDAHGN